ncbi:hypothetical protein N2152v2_005565 [Parachlorella kessleri]
MQMAKPDTLDYTVQFLAKRDGIDKTLKIIRYSTRLLLASGVLSDSQKDLTQRLSKFESSIGTSRKAYRLGKFLGNVNTLRKTPLITPYALLEWVANSGECVYYFVEQLQWLVKSGLLPPHLGPRLTRISATGELIGYTASITLNVLRVVAILEREMLLLGELHRRLKVKRKALQGLLLLASRAAIGCDGGLEPQVDEDSTKSLVAEIRSLRARRRLRVMGLAQDVADSLLAISDLRQRQDFLSNAVLLAGAGLLSGACSAYKNWPGPTT